jgi:NAD(P)-dependent dehydrogenase (short-subunit alcohol dehydrogenase family)
MPTILISGAASGLGKAFLEAYIANPDNKIVAIDRSRIDISTLGDASSRVQTYTVDVTSEDSITAFTKSIANLEIQIIIHSVGIRGLVPSIEAEFPHDVARAETLEAMDSSTMLQTFQVNTIGTFLLIRALLPNLRLAGSPAAPARVIIMGSRMGSVSYNTTGGAYAYRASKAALNAVIKSFAIDVPDIVFAILHPGRVETGLVKCREEGAVEAGESVTDMLKWVGGLGLEKSGKYFDRFGEDIGW